MTQELVFEEVPPPEPVAADTSRVVNHLIWHKAMSEYDDSGEKVNDYIRLVTSNDTGEHIGIADAFHRDLAIAFELVSQHHLDPWDLDLSKFAELYLKEARARGVDLVTAGRIILMAWTVLKLQSDEVAEKATYVEEEAEWDWDSLPDFQFSDEEWDYNERIEALPSAPIDEKIRHHGDRKVTLMELIGALEEVHDEAAERRILSEQKRKNRDSLRRKMRGNVGSMMHKEDLAAEIAETWQRILEQTKLPVRFRDLHEDEPMDLVQTFTSVLFLAKDGKVALTQEAFPYGELWLTPHVDEAVTIIKKEAAA